MKIIIPIIILVLVASCGFAYWTKDEMTCHLLEKERVVSGESSKYVIFCEEEVLQNTDSVWYVKFNSSDIYRDLQPENEYRLSVYGWRVPFLSMYRNIIKLETLNK